MEEPLVFDTVDFEILETFEHEEEVRRPENLRFFTLDEQINDFFEKMLPIKFSRHEEKELKRIRDRIKTAYEDTVEATETDYVIKRAVRNVNLPWIHPVYAEHDYETYSYAKDWIPVVTNTKTPNYYNRLVGALPKPYKATGTGRPVFGNITDKEGNNNINVLGKFIGSKILINDDGTMTIAEKPFDNSEDHMNMVGYYLNKKPFEIPRPIDHPFLKSDKPSFVESQVALMDVYPSTESILEHAIPVTRDPYEFAQPYLKFFGIKLSQIPWNSWRERFPQAEYRDVPIPVQEIPVKKSDKEDPSEGILKYYDSWHKGYHPRYWLTLQVDGGTLLSKILLSDANSVGSLTAYPYSPLTYNFQESEPEICTKLTDSFDAFLDSGIYRKVNGKGQCIPVTTILQEKSVIAYQDRQVFKETTKHDVLSGYARIFKLFKYSDQQEKIEYKKFEVKSESERKKDVFAIMNDESREGEDKAVAIELILRDLELKDKLFYDAAGDFVVCSHTLELLRGALAEKLTFYSQWTTKIEGSRVCKFCGESINSDVFEATNEYDADGGLVASYEPLNSEISTLHSLTSLKTLFDENNSGESLLFITLTYLQIVPSEQQLLQILQYIRLLTANLRSKAKQSGKISKEDQEYTEAVFGIAGAVVLMQTHNPILIPKRKIGKKQFDSTGYPRDSDNPETCNTLSSLISLLSLLMKSFSIIYNGGLSIVFRKLIKDTEHLKSTSLRWIKVFHEKFKSLFESAKERYVEPEKEETKNDFLIPLEKIPIKQVRPTICDTYRMSSVFSTKNVMVIQKPVPLHRRMYPSPFHKSIDIPKIKTQYKTIDEKDIRRRIEIGVAAPFTDFAKKADGPAFVAVTHQILNTLSGSSFPIKEIIKFRSLVSELDIMINASLFRDAAKGILFELLSAIKSPPLTRLINSATKNNITFEILLFDRAKAEKEDSELRAKERNELKAALRQMNDIERETSQNLLALGISQYILTNKDREKFYRDYVSATEIPDEDYSTERDYVENGDLPIAADGTPMQVDYGNYGDMASRDFQDYTSQNIFADDD